MTMTDVAQIAMWFSCGVNVSLAVRTYVQRRRELRAVRQMAVAFDVTVRQFAPVLGFVAALRDTPTVPDELRRAAARVIPPGVTVVPGNHRVH